jgi:hypothetical protein
MTIITVTNTDRAFSAEEYASIGSYIQTQEIAGAVNPSFASSSSNPPATFIMIWGTIDSANGFAELVNSFTPPITSCEVKTI